MSDNVSLKDANNQLEDRGQNPFDNLEFDTFGQTETPSVLVPGYRWKMDSLPTSDPGIANMLWNSNEKVVLPGFVEPTPVLGVPVGVYFPYAGSTAPTGYLLFAPGATIGDLSSTATYKSADYQALFDICKTSWGNAGTETWASHHKVFLPDPTAASLVGVGTSTGFTTNEVVARGVKVDDQFQGHKHKFAHGRASAVSGATNTEYFGTNNTGAGQGENTNANVFAGTPYADASNGTPRIGTTTHGKYLGTYYIIKY